MGYYKNNANAREASRRYNAAKRRRDRLEDVDSSRLIRLETVSEVERYSMAQDVDRMTAYNQAIESWQNSVLAQLRATIIGRSMRIARELAPRTYTDKYGIINRLGFSFPRHGIYIHKGAGRGQGGYIGSKWEKLKVINGIEVSTGIVRHTAPASINGLQGTGNRKAYQWFDPVIKNRLPELLDIVTDYFETMIIDATRIYINK